MLGVLGARVKVLQTEPEKVYNAAMKRKAFSKRYDGVAHRAALRLLSLALLAVCTSSDVHAYSPSVGSAGVGRAGVRELGERECGSWAARR